jgi:beta-amylase
MPAGGNSAVVTSSSSQQPPSVSLKGVASDYGSPLEYNACPMKGVFVPAPSPSPYDLSSSSRSQASMVGDGEAQRDNPPVVGGSIGTINEKQVFIEVDWPLIDLS